MSSCGPISGRQRGNTDVIQARKETHMYGTIASFHIKSGMEAQLQELEQQYNTTPVPGYVVSYVYRMDADPTQYYLVVVFDSKATYQANASSPEQAARYHQFRALLTADPEWHDGEIVSTTQPAVG